MATVIPLVGGPLDGHRLTTAQTYKVGEYFRVVGPKNHEHVYRYTENGCGEWIHS